MKVTKKRNTHTAVTGYLDGKFMQCTIKLKRQKVKMTKKRNTHTAVAGHLDGKLMDAVHGSQSKRETRNASTFNFRQLDDTPKLSPFVSENQLFHLLIKKMVFKLRKHSFYLATHSWKK